MRTIFRDLFPIDSKINWFEGHLILKKLFASGFNLNLAPSSVLEPSAVFSIVKYLENDLQRIFKIFLEADTSATPISFFKRLCERALKAKFFNVY